VTPSYSPDLERLAILRWSLDELGVDSEHYIVVPDEDVPAFRRFGRNNVHIVPTSAVLPKAAERWRRVCRQAGRPGTAIGRALRRGMPGWFAQQIVKLNAGAALGLEDWVCVDSDCCFLRAPVADDFAGPNDGAALFEYKAQPMGPSARRIHADALGFLDLGTDIDTFPTPSRTYVGPVTPLRRVVIERLTGWIDERYGAGLKGLPWWAAMSAHRATEFTTYGLFARHIDGLADLEPVDRRLAVFLYQFDAESVGEQISELFYWRDELRAVMVHSHLDVTAEAIKQAMSPLIGQL
jgi:hypothetical protein